MLGRPKTRPPLQQAASVGAVVALSDSDEGLVCGFDNIPSYRPECLISLGRKVVPGFRLIKCLCLLQGVPLGDGHTFGSRPLQGNNLTTAGAQIATTGSLLRSLDTRDE